MEFSVGGLLVDKVLGTKVGGGASVLAVVRVCACSICEWGKLFGDGTSVAIATLGLANFIAAYFLPFFSCYIPTLDLLHSWSLV